MKTVTIEIPDDCEVKIVKKEEKKEEKKEPVIRTYQDLIDNATKINVGYWIELNSNIHKTCNYTINMEDDKNVAASEKVAKSMLAMAQISQLMPYYGGEVTNEEWANKDLVKYSIVCCDLRFRYVITYNTKDFLAFHTPEQRNEFLKYNEQLVKDYLMID